MRKTLHVFLHGLSLVTLVWIGWSVMLAVQKPSIGAYWGYRSGVVYGVDAGHPSSSVYQIGDRIIQSDELSLSDLYKLAGKSNGDTIRLAVERNGQVLQLVVQVAPSSLPAIFDRLPPFFVALGFWIIGNYVLAFSRSRIQAILFFLLNQCSVISLTCGAISTYGPDWTKAGFYCGILWLGALAVHLHVVFPTKFGKYNPWIGFTYIFANVLLSVLNILDSIWGIHLIPSNILSNTIFTIFGIDLVVVIYLLSHAFRKSAATLVRYQVGIITLSSLLGIIPIVTLVLIPQIIIGHPIVSFEIAFIALLALPVGYGFAIYRYRLIGVKKTINRSVAILLVVLLLTGFYSLCFSVTSRFISPSITQSPVWGLVMTVILAGSAVKLHGSLTRFVNQVLYGGWYDFRTVVEQTRYSLTTTTQNQETIGAALSQVIGQSMRLDMVSLLLSERMRFTYEHGQPTKTEMISEDHCGDFEKLEVLCSKRNDSFLPWSSEFTSVYSLAAFRKGAHPSYFIPLKGKEDHLFGVLMLGEKRDGEPLNAGDFDILRVVIHQAQVTLENVKLLDEAQKHAEKVGRLHRQVIRGREEERKRLARDLHDTVIQSLAGMNYQMAEIRTHLSGAQDDSLVKAQTEIQRLIGVLRQICNDLRPPTLDVLDFYEAIQTKVSEVEENAPFKVRVFIEGNEQQEMGEDVKLCIYRLIQESLINVQKHSQADHVEVWVQVTSERITVMVTDNGNGFMVPDKLELLVPDRHYGLIGIQEMVEAVNGSLSITSSPGQGCILAAQVPI